MDLTIYFPENEIALSDQRIYQVTFSCTKRDELTNTQAARLFIRRNATSSHFIVINDKLSGPDSAGNVAFPTDGLAFFPVFAIVRGVVKLDNRSACPFPKYILGGPDLYLQAYANYSTAYEPGIIAAAAYATAGLVPPLWAMFKGNISDSTKDQLSNFSATEDPLKKALAALSSEVNYPASVKLRPGEFEVSTAFSSVTITVKYIQSVIREGGIEGMKAFRKQIEMSRQSIDLSNLQLCGALANDLSNLGFAKEDDIPYALAYKGIRSNLKADQISQCLGADFAVAAAKIKKGLWDLGRQEQIVSIERAKSDWPPPDPNIPYQADYSVLEAKLFNFTNALSRLARSESVDQADMAVFSKLVSPTVTIVDNSVAKVFGGSTSEVSAGELAKYFISKQYRRFGCAQPTSYGLTYDGGKSLLFAFRANKDDVAIPIEDIAIIKPFFNDGVVSKLIIYDEYDWLNTSMSNRNYSCGSLQVRRPSPAQPVAAGPISSPN